MKNTPYLYFYQIIVTLFLIGVFLPLAAQENGSLPKFYFNGRLGLYTDFYNFNTNSTQIKPRKPSSLGRFVFAAKFGNELFSLPISISIQTDGQRDFRNPALGARKQNLLEYIQNPMNNIGIKPTYKWVEISLGTQVPKFSKLTLGNIRLFGIGTYLTPGKFRFSAFTGSTQVAIEPDATQFVKGAYKRNFYALKLGYGKEESSFVNLNIMKAKDDVNSLSEPAGLQAKEGMMGSLDYRIKIGQSIFIKGEVAGAAYTRNTQSPKFSILEETFDFIDPIYDVRASSRFDYANIISFGIQKKKWNVALESQYIGAGFRSLAYPFLQSDRLDFLLKTRLRLFKNRLLINGSGGFRKNNLNGAKSNTTNRFIGALNANAFITKNFSLTVTYVNFGFRNRIENDTFKIDMISNSFSITPSLTLEGKQLNHTFSLTYSTDLFRDFNSVSGVLNNNDAVNAIFVYQLNFLNLPLTINTSLNYYWNNVRESLKVYSGNLGLNYSFFKRKLSIGTQFRYAQNHPENFTADDQFSVFLTTRAKLTSDLDFKLRFLFNDYRYGDYRPDIHFDDSLLRMSLSYRFSTQKS